MIVTSDWMSWKYDINDRIIRLSTTTSFRQRRNCHEFLTTVWSLDVWRQSSNVRVQVSQSMWIDPAQRAQAAQWFEKGRSRWTEGSGGLRSPETEVLGFSKHETFTSPPVRIWHTVVFDSITSIHLHTENFIRKLVSQCCIKLLLSCGPFFIFFSFSMSFFLLRYLSLLTLTSDPTPAFPTACSRATFHCLVFIFFLHYLLPPLSFLQFYL